MNPFPQREPWVPNQDVFVNQLGELIIEFELSSLRPDDLTLTREENCILVSGNRTESVQAPADPDQYVVRQIARGSFSCTVKIAANFDAAASKAVYSNGILRICVPPTESFKDRLHPPSPPLGAA